MMGYEIKVAQARRIGAAFRDHPPKDDQVDRYQKIRGSCANLAVFLCELCPDRRELNSALKCLEETQSWAISAIARNE